MGFYRAYRVKSGADPEILEAACEIIESLRAAMQAGTHTRIELLSLPAKVVELINQSMGQGEVSVLVREPSNLHIQETVFAGVWRVQEISENGKMLLR